MKSIKPAESVVARVIAFFFFFWRVYWWLLLCLYQTYSRRKLPVFEAQSGGGIKVIRETNVHGEILDEDGILYRILT